MSRINIFDEDYVNSLLEENCKNYEKRIYNTIPFKYMLKVMEEYATGNSAVLYSCLDGSIGYHWGTLDGEPDWNWGNTIYRVMKWDDPKLKEYYDRGNSSAVVNPSKYPRKLLLRMKNKQKAE